MIVSHKKQAYSTNAHYRSNNLPQRHLLMEQDGGSVAKAARNQLEFKLGRSIISPSKASDFTLPEKTEEVGYIEE